MELYKLDSNLRLSDVVSEFHSLIWTERYTKAGDIQLVVPATQTMGALLRRGDYLAIDDSKEVMEIETAVVEDGKLKVSGYSLAYMLNTRVVHAHWEFGAKEWTITDKPGRVMTKLVEAFTILGLLLSDASTGFENSRQLISGLEVSASDLSGDTVAISVPYGPLYSRLEAIADQYAIGMSLYLNDRSVGTNSLRFKTYSGVDRSSNQAVLPVVEFSTELGSLMNSAEVNSQATHANVVYAWAPEALTDYSEYGPGYAKDFWRPNPSTDANELSRRQIMVYADDITREMVGADDPLVDTSVVLRALLDKRAKEALDAARPTQVVDGEVAPHSEFRFGVHYNLGDIVNVAGITNRGYARVSEYIRVKDSSGEKAYPGLTTYTPPEEE